MIFYGASGHGKVIIEAHLASGGKVTGILDDNLDVKALLNYPVSGRYEQGKFPETYYVISIGDNRVRKRVATKVQEKFGTVAHPLSVVSDSAQVGDGSVIMAGVIVNACAEIGKHVILNTGCVIDHDSAVEDFVHVSPNATICGGVTIGEGTHIGAGATVIQNIRIGKWATIAAGAVVINDVPDYAVVAGVPAVVKKINPVTF